MTRVLVVIGTRPEAIKMAPVIEALSHAGGLEPIVVSTGQHREMLQQVFDVFGIIPDHELDAMQPGQTLNGVAARMLGALDPVIAKVEPGFCLVQGDTTSTLIGALASFYRGVPVGHVEAGLRTGNLAAPFPEEGNRCAVSELTSLHFAPTEQSRRNLVAAGVSDSSIEITGNTVIDALKLELSRQEQTGLIHTVRDDLTRHLGASWWSRPFVLVTGHRRENFGDGMRDICSALLELSKQLPEYRFVYPVHLNPNVLAPVNSLLGGRANIALIPPQPYRQFVALMRDCRLILTDSGGVQEEGPSLGKPVLVMREVTERPEGIAAGTVRLVGTDVCTIVSGVLELARDARVYASMATAGNPYGDGMASARIIARVGRFLRSRA